MADMRQRRKPDTAAQQNVEEPEVKAVPSRPLPYDPNWTWSNFDSWPLSVRFAPVYFLLLCCMAAMYYFKFIEDSEVDVTRLGLEACIAEFNYTFRVNAARHQVEQLSTRSWEIGTAAEAMTELLSSQKAVFARNPFPDGKIPQQGFFSMDPGISWSYTKIRRDAPTLFADDWSVSDPASLGVAALMAGQRYPLYLDAAKRQRDYLLHEAPRYINGAISHRKDVAELWADAVFMVPPFLAYYAVQSRDIEMTRQAFRQIQLYRDVLSINRGSLEGLWMHIKGPSEMRDEGCWSTGNAWAAYGMARVRATITGWQPSNETMVQEKALLDQWIGEILDGAIRTDDHDSGLLRNYLGDSSWAGETSGTALLAATAYRLAVMSPDKFGQQHYTSWADQKRRAVFERVDEDGFVKPAVNPLKHDSREYIGNSPEGESFLLILGAAWRDCVCSGVCSLSI